MSRYYELYKAAIEAESISESPRIKVFHKQGLHCRVSLGLTNREKTTSLFISRNPGGDFNQPEAQTIADSIQDRYDMAQYSKESFPHARNLKKVIHAYAEKKHISFEVAVNTFGLTNMSFFHSKNTEEMKESFGVEILESIETVIEEIRPLPLVAIMLSGISYDLFTLTLYQKTSPISDHFSMPGKRSWIEGFRTTIRSGHNVKCIFMAHLSATFGLGSQDLDDIGSKLAEII